MSRSVDVLIVDDRAIDADVTVWALKRVAPHLKVFWLKSGEHALQYLFSVGTFAQRPARPPGLVLLDSDMPIVSGGCVLDVMRAHPSTARMRVVMLVPQHPAFTRHRPRFDADAYVVRDFDMDRYQCAIASALQRWLPPTSSLEALLEPSAQWSAPPLRANAL